MKKIKNILFACIAILGTLTLASCGKKADYTIGILQFATHDALGLATDSFKKEIKDNLPEGKTVKFIFNNPEGKDSPNQTMANSLVKKCDLVLGNATDAATALKNAALNSGKTNLPILFTSVTDPVTAKLVTSLDAPGANVTGVSDINPINEQMTLVKDFDSSIKKIGFMYTISEENSRIQVNAAKAKAEELGYQTVVKTINDETGITATAGLLCDEADIIYIPTDNLLAKSIRTVANVTEPKKTPIICGEGGMVENGGTLTFAVDYNLLGKMTGKMACDILFEGKSVSSIPVQTQTDNFLVVCNPNSLAAIGKTLSDDFKTKYPNIQYKNK